MTPLAEVSGAEAVEQGNSAAEVALPVNVGIAVLLTYRIAGSTGLELAVLAA